MAVLSRTSLMAALRRNPADAIAYCSLGYSMSPGERVKLPDGRTMGEDGLYLESLQHNPAYADAYYYLGVWLHTAPEELVRLTDGRLMRERDLFVETLRHNPAFALALGNLASLLSGGERVKLADGRAMGKRELYIEALRHDRTLDTAYNNIGVGMSLGERVKLADGRSMGQRDLFIEALRYNPAYTSAYNNLGRVVSAGERVTLPDGRTLSKEELLAYPRRVGRPATSSVGVTPAPAPSGASPTTSVCVVCGAAGGKRCGRCKAVVYCGAVCQRMHWAGGHKSMCVPATEVVAPSDPTPATQLPTQQSNVSEAVPPLPKTTPSNASEVMAPSNVTPAEVAEMSVAALKALLTARGVVHTGCVYKSELRDLALTACCSKPDAADASAASNAPEG